MLYSSTLSVCYLPLAPAKKKHHEAVECVAKVVACRAADVGCEFTSARGHMQDHEDKCAVWPLRAILQRQQDTVQRLSRLVEEQQTMLKRQRSEIDELNKDMQALKTQASVKFPFGVGPSAAAPAAAPARGRIIMSDSDSSDSSDSSDY